MGIHTLDIKALKFRVGQITPLVLSAVLLSACSSTSPKTEDNSAMPEAQPFEPQVGTIESAPKPMVAPGPVLTDQNSIRLAADYPREYTVKKGDTLWDIASLFLQDPWYWPEIWQRNPQVKNPHLIYPGDILMLVFVDGRPQIQLARPEDGVVRREMEDGGTKVVKLSPSIHRQTLNEAIPSIPADAVRQFLTRPRIVTAEEWANAPYIVGSDDAHLILGESNKVYVRGELDKERIRYSIFREGDRLYDPDSEKLLGYEIIFAGEARINKYGDPSTGELLKSSREVLVGDRLLPTDKSAIDQQYFPRLPEKEIDGKVISLFDAISSIAKYQIAVINRGSNDGMEVGHLLATYQAGGYARDRFLDRTSQKRGDEKKLDILLPDERSGIMMLFKVFDQVSYGLVLKSTRSIRKHDRVEKPR